MSILSTDKKLISFGTDYSAGNGISIIDHTISIVPSAVGKIYSAGPNIGIYDVSGQPTISSKDWTQEIDQASSGAVTESTSIFTDWVNGQYTGDITSITNNITALSGDLSSYYKKTETSSKEEISAALDYVSAHAVGDVEVNTYVHNNSATIDEVNSVYQSNSASYLTAVNIPESATWNDTSNVVSSNSAQWNQGRTYDGISPIVVNNYDNKISANTWVLTAGNGIALVEDSANNVTRIDCTASGDAGVNSFVRSNSASILEVDTSYKTNSGTFLTAIPSDLATTGDVANLEQTISETYYLKSNPSSFATEDWVTAQGYLTAHQDITNKLDSSAFSSVSGNFLTTAFSIPESATWNDVSTTVQSNSAQWAEGGGSVSSKYKTITVDGSDIEATNSAIEYKSNGFTSSFDYITLNEYTGPESIAWDNYSQDTTLTLTVLNNGDSDALTYSSNTNVTGLITAPQWTPTNVSLSLPNATEVQFSANHAYTLQSIQVSAASSFQVKELAWKSDLPTYSYNSNNKLSAINGSALVGNEDYLVQQGFVQNLSSPYSTIVVKDNKVEGTNSAIKSDTYIEGFTSAYGAMLVHPGNSATLTWANYVPNTKLYISARSNYADTTLTYSADTEVTGTITCPTGGQVSVEVPTDATSIVIGTEEWNRTDYNFTVSAEDYYEVGELAWKSDVPSYEETVLFSSTSGGALSGSFTEELTNFNYIEFFCNRVNTTANSNLAGSLKIAMVGTGVPDEIMLQAGLHTNSTSMFDTREYFNLTNTGFTWAAGYNANITKTGTTGTNIISLDFKNFGITKVIGINRKD